MKYRIRVIFPRNRDDDPCSDLVISQVCVYQDLENNVVWYVSCSIGWHVHFCVMASSASIIETTTETSPIWRWFLRRSKVQARSLNTISIRWYLTKSREQDGSQNPWMTQPIVVQQIRDLSFYPYVIMWRRRQWPKWVSQGFGEYTFDIPVFSHHITFDEWIDSKISITIQVVSRGPSKRESESLLKSVSLPRMRLSLSIKKRRQWMKLVVDMPYVWTWTTVEFILRFISRRLTTDEVILYRRWCFGLVQ